MAFPDTQNTVPSSTAAFLADLQTFLKEEDAERFKEILSSFVFQGGLHPTAAGLTGTFTTTPLIAYPGGFRISDATTSLTYSNAATTWVIAHKDITGNLSGGGAGTFVRSGSTHYLTLENSVTPDLPADSVWLMKVTTSGGAITAVQDLRIASSVVTDTVLTDPAWAVKTDGTDTSAEIQTVLDAVPDFGTLIIPNHVYGIGTKLVVDHPMNIVMSGEFKGLAALGGDYILDLNFATGETQWAQDTKLFGRFEGIRLNGDDVAKGVSFSRVYRADFNHLNVRRTKGTAWRWDRVIECNFNRCTIIDCIDNGTEPLVDFSFENGGSDQTNVTSLFGCSFEACNHPKYLHFETATGATNFALRDIRFYDCLFHGLSTQHVTDDPTRFAINNSLILMDLIEVQHIEFFGCVWQLGASTGKAIVLGAASQEAKHCQFWGGKIKGQGASGTAIEVVSVSEHTALQGVLIDSILSIVDTGQALKAPIIESRIEVDHTRFDVAGALLGRRMTNSGAAKINNTSERSPKDQIINVRGSQLTTFLQQSTDIAQVLREIKAFDAVSGSKTQSFIEELNEDDGIMGYYANVDGVLNLGKASFQNRSLSLKPLAVAPTDKHTGMVVLADGVGWNPLTIGSPHTVLWDGTAWKAL